MKAVIAAVFKIVGMLLGAGALLVTFFSVIGSGPRSFPPLNARSLYLLGILSVQLLPLALAIDFARTHRFGGLWLGKGMMAGGLIALLLNAVDLLVIKRWVVSCSDWCGIENLLFGGINLLFVALGFLFWLFSMSGDTARMNTLE